MNRGMLGSGSSDQILWNGRRTHPAGERLLSTMLVRCVAGGATTMLLAGTRTLAFRPPVTFWGVRGEGKRPNVYGRDLAHSMPTFFFLDYYSYYYTKNCMP